MNQISIFISLFISLFLGYSSSLFAQKIDNTHLRITYFYQQINDTVNHTGLHEDFILDIGDKFSKYESLNSYLTNDTIMKMEQQHLSSEEIQTRLRNIFDYEFSLRVFKNYPNNGNITFVDYVFLNKFSYREAMNQMKWNITNEKDTLLGYPIQKATCSYHGRIWNAWFTTEIPISDGPWKFNGLPGLILKVRDSQLQFGFTAKGIEKYQKPINMYFAEKGASDPIRTTIENYYKHLKGYKNNPSAALNALRVKRDGGDRIYKPKPYNFIEIIKTD